MSKKKLAPREMWLIFENGLYLSAVTSLEAAISTPRQDRGIGVVQVGQQLEVSTDYHKKSGRTT